MDITDITRSKIEQASSVACQCGQDNGFQTSLLLTITLPNGVQKDFQSETEAQQFLEDQMDLMSYFEACRRCGVNPGAFKSPEKNRAIGIKQLEILRRSGYPIESVQ